MNQLTKMLSLLAERHPNIWKVVDVARAMRKPILHHWPDRCFLLQHVAYVIISGKTESSLQEMIDLVDAPRLAALAGWRVTQNIYRFDQDLFDELWDTPVNDIPPQIFHRLPEWCVYIELNKPPFCGVFVHLNYEAEDVQLEQLRFLFHRDGEPEILGPDILVISLNKPTLEEGLAANSERITKMMEREHIPSSSAFFSEAQKMLPKAASLALYLCSQEADYVPRPLPKEKRTKKGIRLFAPDKPELVEVGIRVGAALRKARALGKSEGDGGGSTRSPHVRRAHYHHYWIGPKTNQELIVKWLPPILVNIDKGDIQTTIRPVKT